MAEFPQFPDAPDTLLAKAVRDRLLEQTWGLAEYFTGGVRVFDHEEHLERQFAAPCLGIVIDSVGEAHIGTSHTGSYETVLALALITPATETENIDGLLRSRVIAQIRKALWSGEGCFFDAEDIQIGRLQQFQRLQTGRLINNQDHMLTALLALYETDVDLVTRSIR